MTFEQFTEALDRYGGDLQRWPEPQRAAAADLVARNENAAARLAEARRLDGLLAAVAAPAPIDTALIGRIVAGSRPQGDGIVLRPTRRLLAAASAAMLVLFVAGFTLGATLSPDPGDASTALLLFDGPDDPGDLL